MTEYDNNLRGALFKNDDKREGKGDPDYKGSAEIEGVKYWVSAWVNTAKSGSKYMALRFKAKEERQAPAPAPAAAVPAFADDDLSDLPF